MDIRGGDDALPPLVFGLDKCAELLGAELVGQVKSSSFLVKNVLAKVLNRATFFPEPGSAAASGFAAAFVVVARVPVAEPESGRRVAQVRSFPRSS